MNGDFPELEATCDDDEEYLAGIIDSEQFCRPWIHTNNQNKKGLQKMNENNTKTKKTEFGEATKHPSYATMLFNRSTGGKTALFGSSIEHHDTISLEIYHAELNREFHSDRYYGDKLMLRAEMSYSQFAEAITSSGVNSGVPITLRFTEKDGKIPPCEFTPKREQFLKEFQEKREKATEDTENLIDEVTKLFQKKSLTKGDRMEILSKLQKINGEIGRNMDFIAKMFNQQMDTTVREAKGEVEAFCQNKVQQLASGALIEHRDELEALEGPVVIEDL